MKGIRILYIFLLFVLLAGCSDVRNTQQEGNTEAVENNAVTNRNEGDLEKESNKQESSLITESLETKDLKEKEEIYCRIEDKSMIFYGNGILRKTLVKDLLNNLEYEEQEITTLIVEDGITEIAAETFEYYENLKTIKIAGSVEVIGTYAFYGCDSVEEIFMEEGITIIGGAAFCECVNLTTVTIPKSVKIISSNAFDYTQWLESKKKGNNSIVEVNGIILDANTISADIELSTDISYATKTTLEKSEWWEKKKEEGEPIIINDVLVAWDSAYGDVIVPEGIRYIADGAFLGCRRISSITLPESVEYIGAFAFYNCSLVKIEMQDGVKWISGGAFAECALTNMDISNAVCYMGEGIFTNCSGLEYVSLPEGIRYIPEETFYGCNKLKEVVLPENLTVIGEYAFNNCNNLGDLKLSNRITEIERYAFANCESFTEIRLPDEITQVADGLLRGCGNLESVRIPNGVINIGEFAFEGCTELKEVNMPESLESMGESAFMSTMLSEIVLPEGLGVIAKKAFHSSGLEDVIIPESVYDIGGEAFENTPWMNRKKEGQAMVIVNNILLSSALSTEVVEVPNNVIAISGSAFKNCQMIEIKIPDSVKEIGDSAFEGCSNLVSVTLPESLTEIADYLFRDCVSLQEVILPEYISSIGRNAFENCTNLVSISLPDSVTYIGACAFYDCSNMVSIALPDSIETISYDAFSNCHILTAYCNVGSYAEQYVIENGMQYIGVEEEFWISGAIMPKELPSVQEIIEENNGWISINDKWYHAVWGENGAFIWEYVEATFDTSPCYRYTFISEEKASEGFWIPFGQYFRLNWSSFRDYEWETFTVKHVGDNMFLLAFWAKYASYYGYYNPTTGRCFSLEGVVEDENDTFDLITDFNDGYSVGMYRDVYYTDWAGYKKKNEKVWVAFLDLNGNIMLSALESSLYYAVLDELPGMYSDGCFYYERKFYDINSEVVLDISDKDWGAIYLGDGKYTPYFEDGICTMIVLKNGKYWSFDIDKFGNMLTEAEEVDITLE